MLLEKRETTLILRTVEVFPSQNKKKKKRETPQE